MAAWPSSSSCSNTKTKVSFRTLLVMVCSCYRERPLTLLMASYLPGIAELAREIVSNEFYQRAHDQLDVGGQVHDQKKQSQTSCLIS